MSTALVRTAAILAASLFLALPGAGLAAAASGDARAGAATTAGTAKPEQAYSRRGADTCIACHEDQALMTIFRTPHGAPNDPRSPFGAGQLQCESCHGPSDAHARGRGKDRPDSIDFGRGAKTPVKVQNAMCLQCHQGTANHWAPSQHAGAELSCADCHDSHALHDPMKKAVSQNETCTNCHKSQHTQGAMPFRHPLAEGKMACTSCHAPHGSTNPGMLKARGPFLCQTCHQASGHPSLPFGPNNLPGAGGPNTAYVVAGNCQNCHTQVHGSNHPSGSKLMR